MSAFTRRSFLCCAYDGIRRRYGCSDLGGMDAGCKLRKGVQLE